MTRGHTWFFLCAFSGGTSLGGLTAGQENAIRDLLGATGANRAHTALSMIVGVVLFLFILVNSKNRLIQIYRYCFIV